MFTQRLNLALVLFLILVAACAGPTTDVKAVNVQNTGSAQSVAQATSVAATPVPQPTAAPTSSVTISDTNVISSTGMFPTGLINEPLEVISTSPTKDAPEITVSKDATKIIVQFNHPVVPLVSV